MISPSPTQPPPALVPEPNLEQKPEVSPGRKASEQVFNTTPRKRTGNSPGALVIKAILRPPIKLLYYILAAIRKHKLLSLLAAILLVASISLTSFFTTGSWPFGIGSDPYQIRAQNGQPIDKAGDHVKNWLYALREGNVTQLNLLESELIQSQPPDPQQLVDAYSETKAHVHWDAINVIGSATAPDTTVDTLVSIQFSTDGPGGKTSGLLLIHFNTYPAQNGRMFSINIIGARPI
jgi:hypothetical protein